MGLVSERAEILQRENSPIHIADPNTFPLLSDIMQHRERTRTTPRAPSNAIDTLPSPPPISLVISVLNSSDLKSEHRVITIPCNTSHIRQAVRVGRTINEETRAGVNNLFFDNLVLSRNHAEVYCDSFGRVFIKDLGSTNGTFVNDVRLSPAGQASEAFELIARQKLPCIPQLHFL